MMDSEAKQQQNCTSPAGTETAAITSIVAGIALAMVSGSILADDGFTFDKGGYIWIAVGCLASAWGGYMLQCCQKGSRE